MPRKQVGKKLQQFTRQMYSRKQMEYSGIISTKLQKNSVIWNLDDRYVDATAMFFITKPQMFDVIVTTNLFGDILSDEGAGLVGGLGLIPSANIGEKQGLFEPVHGSAPRHGR